VDCWQMSLFLSSCSSCAFTDSYAAISSCVLCSRVGMVISGLERGADCLHMVQLVPLPSQNPAASCLI